MQAVVNLILGILAPRLTSIISGFVTAGFSALATHGLATGSNTQLVVGAVATLFNELVITPLRNSVPVIAKRAANVPGLTVLAPPDIVAEANHPDVIEAPPDWDISKGNSQQF